MILIIDMGMTWRAVRMKEAIRRVLLPCAVVEPAELSTCGAPLAVIVFSDIAPMLECEFPSFDRERFLIANIDIDTDDSGRINIEISRIIDRIDDLLNVKYGFVSDSLYSGRISVMSGIVRYAGRRIYLTDAELMIVLYLVTKRGRWTSAHELMLFCLDDNSTSVPVHICRINRKTGYISPIEMIRTKRGEGYMLS